MQNRTNLTLLVILLAVSFAPDASASPAASGRAPFALFLLQTNEREQDGLVGPVRRVKTETAKITAKNGKPFEGPRVMLESATYDIKGAKLDHAYFLAAGGSLTGKEVYKYDERGNIIEMTLRHEDGSLLSKETYAYELDAVGNWTKMITSVAVIEGGKMNFEPTEVTYRTIAYFLDDATVAKMSQAPGAAAVAAQPAPANDNKASAGLQNKTAPAAEKAEAKSVRPETKGAPLALPSAVSDKPSVTAPSVALNTNSAPASAGPVVKADGDAPERRVARGPMKPVSGGILNGKAVSLPAPSYPEMAKRARAAGQVSVEVVIDLTGKVISAKAVGGPSLLQAAAEKAAMQARFSPTLLSGQPVKVSGLITYNFTLAQ